MKEADVDHLVELIAKRVESELRQRGGAEAGTAPCSTCEIQGHCDGKRVVSQLNSGAQRLSALGEVGGPACGFVAPIIDHTILKPDASKDELRTVCEEAKRYGFATVCVNSSNVRFTAACLEGSGVKAIAVVGFPLGAATPSAKAFESREAIRNGAQEIDMVINIGLMKSKDYLGVLEDIRAVVSACGAVPVKVILETSKLSHDEKVIGCALSKAAGAAFVKTSTGFGGGGATPEDIALMRAVVGDDMGVKASGGVRNIDDARSVIEAGASRIGASASIEIVECKPRSASSKGTKGY